MMYASKKRGLKLVEQEFVYLDEGAYGSIFVDRGRGRIRKIYRRQPDEQHVRDVFKAETEAYQLAMVAEGIGCLVPGYFEVCPPRTIFDRDGVDVTQEFYSSLAFEAEFIERSFQKIGSIRSEEALRIQALFHSAGITHTTDMSVCLDDQGKVVKAIDFAVREHEAWHSGF